MTINIFYNKALHAAGMEAIRVLVRGCAVLQPGPVRAHLQHRLDRDAALPRHEEADLQPAAGGLSHLRHPVSWTVEFSNCDTGVQLDIDTRIQIYKYIYTKF